jgi:hypothetical protein
MRPRKSPGVTVISNTLCAPLIPFVQLQGADCLTELTGLRIVARNVQDPPLSRRPRRW